LTGGGTTLIIVPLGVDRIDARILKEE